MSGETDTSPEVKVWVAVKELSKETPIMTFDHIAETISEDFEWREKYAQYIKSYCVANEPGTPGWKFLTRVEHGVFKPYEEGDPVHTEKQDAPQEPDKVKVPDRFRHLYDED